MKQVSNIKPDDDLKLNITAQQFLILTTTKLMYIQNLNTHELDLSFIWYSTCFMLDKMGKER